jgi:hypothetical protein
MKKFTTRPRVFRSSPGYIGSSSTNPKNWIYIGRLAEAGPLTDVRLESGNAHVIALFGKRGSGKSYTLGSLLEGLSTKCVSSTIANNSRESAILLFDTLGVFQWMDILLDENIQSQIVQEQLFAHRGWTVNAEKLDISIWIPKGTKTQTSPKSHKEFAINCSDFVAEDWGYLLGIDIYQDRMGQLLNDAFIKVTIEGWADDFTIHHPQKEYSINDLMECVKNDKELISIYHDETRRAILQQLLTFHRNPLFDNKGTLLSDLLKKGQMSIIVMNKMSDELRLIVVAALIRRLMASRVYASEAEKHLKIDSTLSEQDRRDLNITIEKSVPPTWVAIDEAQNILPAERQTSATDILVKYVREGRNYGLSFVVATQQPTSIDTRILSQVDTLIVHKLTVQGDIDYIRKNIKSNLPDETRFGNSILTFEQIIRSLDVGQAFVSNTENERAFIMDVRPRISVHGGF